MWEYLPGPVYLVTHLKRLQTFLGGAMGLGSLKLTLKLLEFIFDAQQTFVLEEIGNNARREHGNLELLASTSCSLFFQRNLIIFE